MHEQAHHAIRAAQHRRRWGRHTTMRYLSKRKIPIRLYQLALILDCGFEH